MSTARQKKARLVLDGLRGTIPSPETELVHRNPFELLVSVILSAQCTDARVNIVTPELYKRFPTAELMSEASADEIFEYIKSISFPNNKAKALAETARIIVNEHDGSVPNTHAQLLELKGVGRKTANVVMSVAFDEPAIAVDTHVFRVSNRIGITKNASTPEAVERQLQQAIPKKDWGDAHHLLILHGRYVCTARSPKCDQCPITAHCDYFNALQKLPKPLTGLDAKKGKYFSKTNNRYFDTPITKKDRSGVEQLADPVSGSMNVYLTKTGKTTKRVKDYRIG